MLTSSNLYNKPEQKVVLPVQGTVQALLRAGALPCTSRCEARKLRCGQWKADPGGSSACEVGHELTDEK